MEAKEPKRDRDRVEALRIHLNGFDTPNLLKLRSMTYERWCWDTGSKDDHEIMRESETILEERGVHAPFMVQDSNGTGITINGDGVDQQDCLIRAKSIVLEDPDTNVRETVVSGDGMDLDLGFKAKQCVLEHILEELRDGGGTGSWIYDQESYQSKPFVDIFQDRLEKLMAEKFIKATEAVTDIQHGLINQMQDPMIVYRIEEIIDQHLKNKTDQPTD